MKQYEVLTDTWLRGRPYASGSMAVLDEEAARGYARAGLIAIGAEPAVEQTADEPATEPTVEDNGKPKRTRRKQS